MSWQIVMLFQIIVSSVMTIFSRKLALADRKLFYVIGVCSYAMVAVMGIIYTLVFQGGVTGLPSAEGWLYIVVEGICIPASWLLLYKLIGIIGASNSMIVSLMNTMTTAFLGIVLLREPLTLMFLAGAALLLASGYLALTTQADTEHHRRVALGKKIGLIAGMVALYAAGMYSEKQAIDTIGVWDYAAFGWSMQFVGAIVICALFGRSEFVHVKRASVHKGLLLGFMTSIAGVLYIYALSIGTLSHTVVANSGRVGLTMILAALLLNERNALGRRTVALVLSIAGVALLFA